jgi:methylmalonyl-CoA carboxyltransferase 5S subunit
LKPKWEHLRSDAIALEGCNGSDEDVLTHAMFPQVAPKFFKSRKEGAKNLGKDPAKKVEAASPGKANGKDHSTAALTGSVNYVITLNGKEHRVTVAPSK